MEKEPIRIVFHGDPAAVHLNDEEQRIFYSGVFQIHGEIFTNTYPAIIEESLFQRVQDLIQFPLVFAEKSMKMNCLPHLLPMASSPVCEPTRRTPSGTSI